MLFAYHIKLTYRTSVTLMQAKLILEALELICISRAVKRLNEPTCLFQGQFCDTRPISGISTNADNNVIKNGFTKPEHFVEPIMKL